MQNDSWHPALDLVPHRPPMLLVDEARLLPPASGDGDEVYRGEARSVVKASWPLLDAGGALYGPALFEVAAQSFAALAVLKLRELGLDGEPRMGFLVALKRFAPSGAARVGDKLHIKVHTVAALGEFTVLEAEISRNGEMLAGGQLKIYAPGPEAVEAMLGAQSVEK